MKDYELLRKQADMMEMAEKYGVDDWRKLVLVKFRSGDGDFVHYSTITPYMNAVNEHKFALGVVEGKPVFEGDTLYMDTGDKFTAGEFLANKYGEFICQVGYSDNGGGVSCSVDECSWNPPAPKTVMVELLVEDAEYWHKRAPSPSEFIGCDKTYREASMNFYDAVGKALEANRE